MLSTVIDNAKFLLACGGAVIALAVAYMIVFRGGKVKMKAGPAEMTIDAPTVLRKLNEIHQTVEKVNGAVNNRPGDSLIARVILTQQMLKDHMSTEEARARVLTDELAELKAAMEAHLKEHPS